MTEATQEGVEEKPVSEREAAIEAIAEKNRQERAEYHEELGVELDVPVKPEAEKAEEEQVEEKQEVEEEKKVELVKIKVDGQEKEVPVTEIMEAGTRTLQKESAADKRLEEATRMLKQAEERFNSLASKDPEKPDLSKADDLELARSIQMGTEDEASAAIKVLRDRENVSPEEAARIAAQ